MESDSEETKYHIKPQSSISKFLLSPSRPYTVSLLAAGTTLLLRATSTATFSIPRLAPPGFVIPAPASHCLASLNLVWLGFDLSICFMEAWVKFNAPTAKREQLLDVGRHVFTALNSVELVFGATGVWLSTQLPGPAGRDSRVVMTTVAGLVLLEGLYFIPSLARRISENIKGREVPKSHLHAIEALISVLKVALLAGSLGVIGWPW